MKKKEIDVILELTPQASSEFTKALLKIYENEEKKKYRKLKEVS